MKLHQFGGLLNYFQQKPILPIFSLILPTVNKIYDYEK